ncbi:Exosome component EXOSC1/CSL4 [Nesidiocoris tenuis]|uniref:Exosome component EXOSC1/CSL4 n=1 Tax=Nesidiocoris tenuis TaxID=355587 RepID=A0ABN7AY81_9HEMI|nr:Exosome component EXOSC1/CSL4 [Nesidiocoris tenuis]
MTSVLPKYCVPGQRLCVSNDSHIPGSGTYEWKGYIHSSVAGLVNPIEKEKAFEIGVLTNKGHHTVPTPGDIVTAQVTVITQRYVRCNIQCVRDTPLEKTLRGVVKKDDIRATNKDSIEIHKCFRPGDIILARILPIKELQSYQLSTAEDELGVVIALSEAGENMVPISWTEMQCPKTYAKEWRKVAKIIPEDQ